jgi:DNA polymerase I-like protein with 3'-5' exonuclease and polymerase domains
MVRVAEYLAPLKSRMILSIHDEIILEVHKSEAHILPDIKAIMEGVYTPRNGLAMSCGVEHSFKNLADKVEGFPK